MQFRLKKGAGNHAHTDGKIYKAGDVIESDVNLENLFRGKFEKVYEPPKISKITKPSIPIKKPIISTPASMGKDEESPDSESLPVEEEEINEDEETEDEDVDADDTEYGTDVTAEFPLAEKVELEVYDKAHWYTVIDPEDGEVMNEKKLRRKDVDIFLEQYVE